MASNTDKMKADLKAGSAMTAIELAEKMLLELCHNQMSRYDINGAGLSALEAQLIPAMGCNWTDENISVFVTGAENDCALLEGIIPNGYNISKVLDDIFEGKYKV